MRLTPFVMAAALAAVPCLSSGGDEKKPSPRPKRVYTEDDLRGAGRPRGTVSQPGSSTTSEPDPNVSPSPSTDASPSPDASPGAVPSPGASPEPTEEEKRATAAKGLQNKIDFYARYIATTRADIEKAQLELNDLTNYTFGGRRTLLMEQIEMLQKNIREAEANIGALEEEARRAGVRVTRP
jgi:hypothetical protein